MGVPCCRPFWRQKPIVCLDNQIQTKTRWLCHQGYKQRQNWDGPDILNIWRFKESHFSYSWISCFGITPPIIFVPTSIIARYEKLTLFRKTELVFEVICLFAELPGCYDVLPPLSEERSWRGQWVMIQNSYRDCSVLNQFNMYLRHIIPWPMHVTETNFLLSRKRSN